MIALYIILGILLALFLITLINVWVLMDYDEELRLYVRVAFVKIQLVPPKPKKEKKKPKKEKKEKPKKPKKEKAEKKKSFDFKEYVKDKGVSGLLNIIKRVAELAGGTLKDLFSKIVIQYLALNLRIAGSDAADSAVKYGRVCAVLYPSLKIISEVVKLKDYKIDVEPDFSDEPKNSAKCEVKARIRIISVLAVVLKRGIQAIRLILKAKPKHKSKKASDNKET